MTTELDDEDRCTVLIDLGQRCDNPATMTVREPYTPAAFEIRCCNDCGESLVSQDYTRGEAAQVKHKSTAMIFLHTIRKISRPTAGYRHGKGIWLNLYECPICKRRISPPRNSDKGTHTCRGGYTRGEVSR